ncbi:MAG: hypothetical protein KAI47_04845 [Deltaproteobacteria bacterium]|nr:hypothetical protein [Deltaproteobacteria bacterium]
MTTNNPYQPPVTNAAPPNAHLSDRSAPGAFDAAEIDEARRRLKIHCADIAAQEKDRLDEGMLLRPVTIVFSVLTIAVVGVAVGLRVVLQSNMALFIGLAVAAFFALFALVLLINNLLIGRRRTPTTPADTLKRWFRAARANHSGYIFVSLAPTARDSVVEAPRIDETLPPSQFKISSKEDIKRYLKSWARPDKKFVRWMKLKKVALIDQPESDLARVKIEVALMAWPQWANILTVVFFLFIRIIGIILGLVLYYTLRKRQTIVAEKLLLRGDDNLWYLLDADLRR